jgi:hypothetical protein
VSLSESSGAHRSRENPGITIIDLFSNEKICQVDPGQAPGITGKKAIPEAGDRHELTAIPWP